MKRMFFLIFIFSSICFKTPALSGNKAAGSSCTPPATQASNFSTSNVTNSSITVSWSRGSGNSVFVVARAGSAVNADPINGNFYTANAAFGSGSQVGTGNYAVYDGMGTSVNVTGLSAGTVYHFAIYEYDNTSNCFKTPALSGIVTGIGKLNNTNLNIYPNPFGNYLNIENNEKLNRLIITNIIGQKVLENENPGERINTQNLKAGLYLISLFTKEGLIKTMKIIKTEQDN
jgi:hypothetical protein